MSRVSLPSPDANLAPRVKSQRSRTLRVSVTEVGEPVGLLGVTRDVSERVRVEREKSEIEDQLRHVQKLEAMGILAGGIAHDFNNLLHGIMGYANLLKIRSEPEDFAAPPRLGAPRTIHGLRR